MPSLPRPSTPETLTLAPRTATVAARCDVLVVGGGPAGIGAALGAAWSGADVVLAERYGFLGGNATAALVMPLMSFHTQSKTPAQPLDTLSFLPTDHGTGDPVVGGALTAFLERLFALRGAIRPSEKTGFVVPFDPEMFKLAAQEVVDEAGVKLLFHAFASGVTEGTRPRGVVFESKSGPLVVQADIVVDCTGDGDIAAAAGARYEVGRPEDGLVQPMTLMFRMVGFDADAFTDYVAGHPDQWRGVHGLWDLIAQGTATGELTLPREDILFFATPHAGEISLNCTRVTGALGTSVWDLTRAEMASHAQMAQIARFLRDRVPGFQDARVVQSGVQVGVRESRRIVGDYTLTAEDVLEARKFDDGIARSTYPVDIHNPKGKGTVLRRLPPGEWYDVPLRALLPQGLDDLLVAGRCLSGTHEAHSSYRVTPTAMATGHAAGVAAALAARRKCGLRDIGHRTLQAELWRQGGSIVPP
ncbi:FAD-dependent oxidoreductase [Novispirillum sp. DQ9]|uniref:FAD-dependent oxidoreductase n=1 Tax=Novispirillum sp. DQ9 TaxID=3398612 RepID=UPI003C7AF0D4